MATPGARDLLIDEPNRGFRVRTFTGSGITNMIEVRWELEARLPDTQLWGSNSQYRDHSYN